MASQTERVSVNEVTCPAACTWDVKVGLLKACGVLFNDTSDYAYPCLMYSAHCSYSSSLMHLRAVGACLGPEAAAGG